MYLNGEILGLSRKELDEAFPRIEAFAEIGQFIDRPVKEYSSGMYVRLAFSTAIHVDPEVLIVDEALAVGDAIFASRCVQKFEELRRKNVTVLLVSHDLGLIKRLADRAAFMLDGRIVMQGAPKDAVNRYVGFVLDRERASKERSAGLLEESIAAKQDQLSPRRRRQPRDGRADTQLQPAKPATLSVPANPSSCASAPRFKSRSRTPWSAS